MEADLGFLEADELGFLEADLGFLEADELGFLEADELGFLEADELGFLETDELGFLEADELGFLEADELGFLEADVGFLDDDLIFLGSCDFFFITTIILDDFFIDGLAFVCIKRIILAVFILNWRLCLLIVPVCGL